MGMRHRSIGLRVGLLIAVPALSLVLLYAFVASITLSNALTNTGSTAVRNDLGNPIGVFQLEVAVERGLAVLSLAAPSSKQIAGELATQEAVTSKSLAQLQADFGSPAVTSNASGAELAAMRTVVRQGAELTRIRSEVTGHTIGMRTALADYDSVIQTGYVVLDRVFYTEANAQQVTQAIDLVNLDRARQDAIAEGDLLAGDMAMHQYPDADRMTIASLAATRQGLIASSLADLQPSYRAAIDRYLTPSVRTGIQTAEAAAANTRWHSGAPPPRVLSASNALTAYPTALEPGLLAVAAQIQQTAQRQGNDVLLQLILAGGLGLLALIATVVLSVVLGRGLIRQLRDLRGSALTVAHHTLPGIIGRLRSGEAVDLNQYAAREFATHSEIEQVGQAVSVLQQAAVQSAADEARLRRGISDVFRNLAGRSQSLLHRQLTLIDAMERRTTDPDELERLFRIDHLTTRMRRHAEGLIILSGDTPTRSWRRPVPLVDVLRAAVAEVEDYTRVRVQCRTSTAVVGHAVADIVHLLAELAENATVFSPPNSPVRMQGETSGQGLVIEIEDRGLGISRARLEEINARLANPPQFDPIGSDRLGLFIASQLARRHDITVALRPSVYGGTTAIVHLPAALVADDESAGPDGTFQLGRASGRSGALGAVPAGNGHQNSGGFNFGRVPQADNGAGDTATASANQVGDAPVFDTETGGTAAESGITAASEASDTSLPVRRRRPSGTKAGESTAKSEITAGAEPTDTVLPVRRRASNTKAGESAAESRLTAAADLTDTGLPVRVRQASIAPQLRDTPPGPAEPGPAGGITLPRRTKPPSDSAPTRSAEADLASPEAARAMVSAFQRGWQRGRTDSAPETLAPETPAPATDEAGGDAGDHDEN